MIQLGGIIPGPPQCSATRVGPLKLPSTAEEVDHKQGLHNDTVTAEQVDNAVATMIAAIGTGIVTLNQIPI